MRTPIFAAFVLPLLVIVPIARGEFPTFRGQEIDRSLKIGYAVTLADVNGDGKPDVVVCDKDRVIYFSNPDWKLHTILQGQTKLDNVCIDAYDVDGDGHIDLALGAGWRPSDTNDPGTIQWLRNPGNDQPWELHPIGGEPNVHRMRWIDLDGDGRKELVVSPLQGRGTTAKKNWSEHPTRLLAFKIPADPAKGPWTPVVINEEMHTIHNFWPVDFDGDGRVDLLTASYEGVSLLRRSADGAWSRQLLGQGNQEHPESNRGSSEIKLGRLKDGKRYIATVEPWHGFQIVVYTPGEQGGPWSRKVIDSQLKWGHAVQCVDVDGDGEDELIVGVRDPLNEQVRSGVNVHKLVNGAWQKHVIDNGGVATEDMAVGDLNGDGKPDLVAVGRATKNVKIYWNEGLAAR